MKNTFLDNLRPASWRGVPFFVSADDSSFGRNVVIHEFAQRDKHYVEDMGRKRRELKLDAWVCAAPSNNFNPFPARDALIAAVEEGGEGTLVHPHYGSLRGHVSNISVKQTTTEGGGMISFSIDFVEAGERDFRATTIEDTLSRVTGSALDVYDFSVIDFGAIFKVVGFAGFVLADALSVIKKFKAVISKSKPNGSISRQLAIARINSNYWYSNPERLASDISIVISESERPEHLHYFGSSGSGAVVSPPVDITTANAMQQKSNQEALVHLIRIVSRAKSAELAADLVNNSARYSAASVYLRDTPALITRDEMIATRRSISELLTDELVTLSDIGIYQDTMQAMIQLKTDIVGRLTAEGEHLARTFVTSCCDKNNWNGPMQSIVLAYRHYGLINDDVLIERNNIPNPLFIQPNANVELLTEINA